MCLNFLNSSVLIISTSKNTFLVHECELQVKDAQIDMEQ